MTPKSVRIFNYYDYREYLSDFYEYKKSTVKEFSHRQFLKMAGIPGSVYLQRILKDQRKLSLKFVSHFDKALNHSAKESRYFRLLVQFRNEKKPILKEKFLRELLTYRYSHAEHTLVDNKLHFYGKWYYAVIRELLLFHDFRGNYQSLARCVIPKISAAQAKSAVEFLLKNEFVRLDKYGRYVQVDPVITTGSEVNSTLVTQYHKKNLLQAAQAVDDLPKNERDISSITLSVSNETYDIIKEEIRALRKRLLSMAKEDPNPQKVCLVGFQLLPRSKAPGKKGKK